MEGNTITSFENLCKIFEMRIRLDKEKKTKTPLDILDNYEKYSKKIDSMYNLQFQKELKPLISPGITLEKEEDRLRRLIRLLEERLEKRVELEDKFYNSTGKYMTGLQIIVSEDELEDKRQRLSLVSRYLETNTEITDVTESINKLRDSLASEENKKEEYKVKNGLMEDELYSSFMVIVNTDEYYRSINEEDIALQLEEIRSKVSETKETLDITKESIGSLITSGLEDDYASYVEEAEKNYFNYKNRELILKIYKLVVDFEDDFKLICAKREKIGKLVEEQRNLRDSLSIETADELLSFEKILVMQNSILDNEREILENIANYTSRIKFKEERLEELNEVNNSVEILAILREYGLIDTYDTEEVDEDESSSPDELIIPDTSNEQENVVEEFYDPYRIVEVKDYPKTLNIGLAKLKGESVREKVNKKLNPKKEDAIFEDITYSVVQDNINEIDINKDKEEFKEELSNIIPISSPKIEIKNNEPSSEIIVSEPIMKEEENINTPVWELPKELDTKPINIEPEKTNDLPAWDMIAPLDVLPSKEEDFDNFDHIDIVKKEDNNIGDNSAFWVPFSEVKLDSKSLPNLNNSNNGFAGNDNFIFPTLNS